IGLSRVIGESHPDRLQIAHRPTVVDVQFPGLPEVAWPSRRR
ncbi:MAG: hypothetical protein K0R68_1849, partial [Mycobacterium sp.]|nr:hypothetical protein [Mycobacterium sp.]